MNCKTTVLFQGKINTTANTKTWTDVLPKHQEDMLSHNWKHSLKMHHLWYNSSVLIAMQKVQKNKLTSAAFPSMAFPFVP